jgi:PAS domain S-box-containing protein
MGMGYLNCSTKQSWWAFTYDPQFAMTDSIKIIQDISLLYELSLSLGNSLDPSENCQQFLDTLIRRKSLSFASVWLRNATAEAEHTYTVFCTFPQFREAQKSVVFREDLVQKLASKSWLSISDQDPYFQEVIQEKKIKKGTYALFKLGNLGFLKLFAANRSEGFPEIEMAQLKQVIDKLEVSLEGCFAYLQLKQETQNRLTTQKALEESENKLRRIIDSSLDAVVSADDAGMAVEWSSQAEKMFGYTRQEVLGKPLRDIFIPKRHWHLFQNAFDDYLRTTDESLVNRRYEIKCIRKNGEEFLAELSITSDVNEKNRLFVGFLRDITEQRKAKKEIEIARNRMENLISNLQTGILLEDSNRQIVLVNQSFCDFFSIPVKPNDLVGQDCSQAAEQSKHLFQDPVKFVKSIDRALKDKRLIENEVFMTTNGRVFERNFIPLFSGDVYEGHLWQYRDITERQNTEQAIRESEEKYRGVLENMDLGLLEVDIEENIIQVNNAFCQMVGYLPEELLGKNTGELFLPFESKKIILARLEDRKKGLSSVYELQMQRKDGSLLWFLISGAPVKDSSGKIIGSIGIHFDLTARKKLENDLAVAKQVADRARLAERQFLTHMSHEIRTPINAVIGMTHLLNETQPNPTQKDYLDSLSFSASSLLGIIDNILDFSKIDAGELEFEHKRFDLSYLLKSLLQSLQFKKAQKDIQILKDLDPAIEHLVIGDPTRVNQILTNLLGNALKFTEKGTVRLSTKLLNKSEGQVLIEFRVHDTGIGIPDDKHEIIFEYFKQADVKINREFGGTGLGLTIVKQLVEMMGGTIRVESQLGVGSDFILTLPFGDSGIPAPDSEMLTEMDTQESQTRTNGLHFLIVEDNLINQKLLCKTIELWDSTVQVANNGLEALEKTATARFDVILMDIHMPVLGGFETTLAIRNDENNPNKNVPIIALTAAALSADKKKAFEVGMNGFLTKPISPKELQEHILQAIKLSRSLGNEVPMHGTMVLDASNQVDLGYLLEISNNDVQFVEEIIATFLKETPTALQALQSCTQHGVWEESGKIVHKLKPNFALLGLKKLAEEAAFIEEGIRTGQVDPSQMATLISGLVAQANTAMASISQLKFH